MFSDYSMSRIVSSLFYSYDDNDIVRVLIGGKTLELVAAKSYMATRKGLGDRLFIPKDGMIFFFEKNRQLVFWMKDMYFPIDILWISDGKIIGSVENVQPEKKTPDSKLKKYYSPSDVDIVIELKAGRVKELGIKINDTINIER
ncbi:MAG: DUF192 domain-containing protein [Elusimicrobiota bacterium]|jgi:uncharacterized membrane protein (UPF0127 family)|nr:DUF192 domain-containing protein [Elusimicrobiota bacterium]